MICHPKANGPWVKNYDLKNKVIVIPDLTEDDTVKGFTMKVKKEDANCSTSNRWRVFCPQTLPDWIVW
jgi:peroxiredoxin